MTEVLAIGASKPQEPEVVGLERFCRHKSCHTHQLAEAKRKTHHPELPGRWDGKTRSPHKAGFKIFKSFTPQQ